MSTVDFLKKLVSYQAEIQQLIATELIQLLESQKTPMTVLDIGCGKSSMLKKFSECPQRKSFRLIGLDAHQPSIDWCRQYGFHDEYICADARDLSGVADVDVVVATDLVEHFSKEEAMQLISCFERKATRLVLLLTPNGFVHNPFSDENPFMQHKCGFDVAEFERLGYECSGVGGPKKMRGPQSLTLEPKMVFLPLVAVLSRVMRKYPQQSFHILAAKSIKAKSMVG